LAKYANDFSQRLDLGWLIYISFVQVTLRYRTVGPISQKALNKVVSYTDATRHYQLLPVATRHYQMLTDVIRLSNPTVFRTNLTIYITVFVTRGRHFGARESV
jgi:hypothetical protein